MAAVLHDQLGLPATLEPGARGEFSVWVDDQVVARKTLDGFPSPDACCDAVHAALGEPDPPNQ